MDSVKRLGKMKVDLDELSRYVEYINAEEKSFDKYRDAWPADEQNKMERSFARSKQKIEKDLLNIWSKIRGYKFEAEVSLKQLKKFRTNRSQKKRKQGDIASKDIETGQARVYQLKSCSSHDNGGVNQHIQKAFLQLFGGKKEVPKEGAKLISEIELHSGKCYWPMTQPKYQNKDVKKGVLIAAARKAIDNQVKTALNTVIGNKLPAAKEAFYLKASTTKIEIRIRYRKQLQTDNKINGKYEMRSRCKEQALSVLVFPVLISDKGVVSVGHCSAK
ncbi:hypothetical protein Q5Y75_07860 [Ruegeria sp. 2205SS24-7]|uniref:hypothetical protein n=1 Tax=Ruegeria discodermiae TaxID=3064389 RepID=UPI00274034F4|nr:hypothetical protein [Ruegeria sp. 2205SS24-7]MDP5217128.1 hypothetical protein [Ruegeria sp. 2205SS24-7]